LANYYATTYGMNHTVKKKIAENDDGRLMMTV